MIPFERQSDFAERGTENREKARSHFKQFYAFLEPFS